MATLAIDRAGAAWRAIGENSYERGQRARTGGRLIYAVGDVHGRYDLLKALLAQIADDAAASEVADPPLLILLGDYIDRGPESASVIDALIWLQRRSPFEVHPLKGNHEQACLDFLDGKPGAEAWLGFGGEETLRSYGVAPPETEDARAIDRLREDFLDRLPASHLRLLEALPLMVEVGDFAFVHAGVRPGVPFADQKADDLLWIREDFLETRVTPPKTIVHGHSWTSAEPAIHAHRIGLDTGAYATDTLSAARIRDGSLRILQSGMPDAR